MPVLAKPCKKLTLQPEEGARPNGLVCLRIVHRWEAQQGEKYLKTLQTVLRNSQCPFWPSPKYTTWAALYFPFPTAYILSIAQKDTILITLCRVRLITVASAKTSSTSSSLLLSLSTPCAAQNCKEHGINNTYQHWNNVSMFFLVVFSFASG